MSALRCRARGCAALAHHPTGMCAAHRRALILTTTVQDALREFLHGNRNLTSSIKPTQQNIENVTEAGIYIAEGLSLLVSSLFGSAVHFDDSPIELVKLNRHEQIGWRVLFNWYGSNRDDDDGESDDGETDDELEHETQDQECR